MKAFCAALVTSIFLAAPALAANADQRFLEGREAARRGDLAKLQQLIEGSEQAPLDAYIEYWALSLRAARDEAVDADYTRFLAREEGSLIGERARQDWIRNAGRNARWELVLAQAPLLRQPDMELNCWQWQARLARQDASVEAELTSLWESTNETGEACTPLLTRLAVNATPEALWKRARTLVEARRFEAARSTLGARGEGAPPPRALEDALKNPARLFTQAPATALLSPNQRGILVLALQRLAQLDYPAAAAQFEALGTALNPSERAWLSAVMGLHAARANRSEASAWYRAARGSEMTEEQRAWQVRHALRQLDWVEVRSAIEAMPSKQRSQTDWSYWYARALLATSRSEAETLSAQMRLASLAGRADFYSMLAGEELGQTFRLPKTALPPSAEEIARAEGLIGIRRALTLLRLDGRIDGVREWNWALRESDDRVLLAAAEIARREQLYDRAIYAAERTRLEHDYALRYLVPYYDKVAPVAKRWRLDLPWMYGLMRQESRFVAQAKSSAGAQGLMQVMPGTAKLVARKIGMAYEPGRAHDPATNLELGAAYLRMMLDKHDEQAALATAAYNAGPTRVPRWKATQAVEGAIFAETIPLTETRDYVKKVMANAVAYAALLSGSAQSLKGRLGTVLPQTGPLSSGGDDRDPGVQ